MKYCCFFGHRDCGDEVYERLKEVIISLWKRGEAEVFLVGNQGRFDFLARKALKELEGEYPTMKYYVVLAYLNRGEYDSLGDLETHSVYPEGLESAPPRFALDRRNRWMVEKSDTVVVYVRYPAGNSRRYADVAAKKGKRVINLALDSLTGWKG